MINVAVIGAGWYAAQNHIPVLKARRDVVLDGVCRLGAAELARVRDHFGFAFASEDHHAVLARRPEAVVVASPHHLHYRHAADALDAGAHVLCEKPMTLAPEEAWDLVARARRARRQLIVANGHHWLPMMSTIGEMLQRGVVGRIEHVLCSFVSCTRPVFEGDEGLRSWKTTFFRPSTATWQVPENGGGFAYGQLSHSIALMLWLTRLVPREAGARTFGTGAVDLCDAGIVRFACGAVASISGAAGMPEGHRPLLRLVVTGSHGMMTIDVDRDAAELRLADGEVGPITVPAGAWIYNCVGPVEALVDLAQGRGANLAPGEIGAATTSVIAAMLASARSGGAPMRVLPPPT
jgi:predicted dehydrogenase